MLIDSLKAHEQYYMACIRRANKLTSMFRVNQDHVSKLNAVRKLIKDISHEDVWYSKHDLDILNSGKLGHLLQKHHHELPTGFVNSSILASNKCA